MIGVLFFSLVVADVVSVNSGGGNQTIINPGGNIEGFFSQANRIPVVANVILSSTSGNDLTTDNLTVTFTSSDADADPVTNITDWRLDGSSIAVLNMPFDKNVAELTAGAVRDYSTYGNNGTLGGGTSANAPTWNSTCQVGGCYGFDGMNDFMEIEDSNSLDLINTFTISLWMKPSVLTQTNRYILSKLKTGTTTNNSYSIIWEYTDNQVEFYSEAYSGTDPRTSSGMNVNNTNWNHVVYAYDGTTWEGYLNGSKIFSVSRTFSFITSTGKLIMGNLNHVGGSWFFNGSIDEVQIFNRSLSSEQIQSMYQEGLAGHQVEKLVSEENDKGDVWRVAVIPNDKIADGVMVLSNTLTITDSTPENPTSVNLVSLNGRNESNTDLNCSAYITDVDNTELDVNVNWFKGGVLNLSQSYGSQNNGTTFYTLLDNGNLTLGDTWMCSVRTYDGNSYSNWENSNNLTIIDITSPNVSIMSPNSTFNYISLEVDFNVTVFDNENVSMCFYSLDNSTNVTMTEVNDSYFWDEPPSLGPGYHDLDYYCNDTSNNWGTNYTNFTIDNSAAISILLSDNLTVGVRWEVQYLPAVYLDALGNNLNSSTYYYINISATNTLVDLYVRADGDLENAFSDTLGLENETYAVNTTNSTVPDPNRTAMTTNYTLFASGMGDNSVVYMKFYLNASATQPAGIYTNQLQFLAVRNGQSPN